jgi:Fe2+ transport system protein FeoA
MINSKGTKFLLAAQSGNAVKKIGSITVGLESKLRRPGILPGDFAKVIRRAPMGGTGAVKSTGVKLRWEERLAWILKTS